MDTLIPLEPIPEPTTAEKIAALAKARDAKRHASTLDFGLWDAQLDLVDAIKAK